MAFCGRVFAGADGGRFGAPMLGDASQNGEAGGASAAEKGREIVPPAASRECSYLLCRGSDPPDQLLCRRSDPPVAPT